MSDGSGPVEDQVLLQSLDPCEHLVLENWARGKQETGLFQEVSFVSVLHETGRWDEEHYWELDKALYEICGKYEGRTLPRLLVRALMDLFVGLTEKLAHHRMPSDLWQIKNLSDQDCHEWSERVTAICRAAIAGERFENKYWDRLNPLLD